MGGFLWLPRVYFTESLIFPNTLRVHKNLVPGGEGKGLALVSKSILYLF
jgi:hypothetical protein